MTQAKRLLRFAFAIEGGHQQGLGHVMRCAALAARARQRGHAPIAFLECDAATGEAWARASAQTPALGEPTPANSANVDALVIDVPGDKTQWLRWAAHRSVPTLVLDDPGFIGEAERTILPGLHARNMEDRRLLSGPRWSILAAPHRNATRAGKKNRLLLSIGGADPHGVTARLAPLLKSLFDLEGARHGFVSADVVLGPAFRDEGGQLAAHLAGTGWTVHPSIGTAPMASLMAETRLAVCGFGTTLNELAAHRTPYLCVAHHARDTGFAWELEQRGIGRSLGLAGELDLEEIRRIVSAALADASWRERSADRAWHLIEGGQGVDRILDEIEGMCGAKPAERRAHSKTSSAAFVP